MISPSSFTSTLESTRFENGRADQPINANPATVYDAELVRRFKSGDAEAFVEIVSRHRGMIFSLALGHLHNSSDAEEIAQDTCIHAYRGLAGFRGESSLATWLYRIVFNISRNRCAYFLRRRRRETCSFDSIISSESDMTLGDILASDRADPACEEISREFLENINVCMGKLCVPQREILILRNFLGQSYEEIAVTLHIKPGTVKSRIARARENLHVLLARKYGEFTPEGINSYKWFERDRRSGNVRTAVS